MLRFKKKVQGVRGKLREEIRGFILFVIPVDGLQYRNTKGSRPSNGYYVPLAWDGGK